jgi:hypothetical protein
MAKKKEEKKAAQAPSEKKAGNAPPKKSVQNMQATIFTVAILVLAIVFLPSSLLLMIGMMPSLTVIFVDPARARTKVVTVGVMNLAGCVPFLLDLWTQGHSIDQALSIVADPMAIIVMYSAAAIGYLLDWSLSAIVAGILYQRGQARVVAIRKRQEELVARWGVEVTGHLALDEHGFASESDLKEHR